MLSPFKGRTGLKRIVNAAGYSWDGLRTAFRGEAAFRQLVLLNAVLVPLDGTLRVNGTEDVPASRYVVFEQTGGGITVEAQGEDVKALLLTGVPLNEPIAGYGPFVMNTEEEIRQAFVDYREGRFGPMPVRELA